MKVSVIIPYKTDRGWLQEAIDSVPKEAELIISRGNGNCQKNFNNGIRKASGDIIRWLHEDDRLTENSIQDTIETFEQQDCDFIHGCAYQVHMGGHGRRIPFIPKKQYPTLQEMLKYNRLHGGTLAFSREVFDKIGYFDQSLIWAEEYEFTLRCLYNQLKLGYCNTFLYEYRVHENQKSNADHGVRQKYITENIRSKYANY